MDTIELHKYLEAEKVLDILDDFLDALENMREKIRQEIFYGEL